MYKHGFHLDKNYSAVTPIDVAASSGHSGLPAPEEPKFPPLRPENVHEGPVLRITEGPSSHNYCHVMKTPSGISISVFQSTSCLCAVGTILKFELIYQVFRYGSSARIRRSLTLPPHKPRYQNFVVLLTRNNLKNIETVRIQHDLNIMIMTIGPKFFFAYLNWRNYFENNQCR